LIVPIIVFAIVACDFLEEHYPAPDVRLLRFTPLARYIYYSTRTVYIDTAAFVPLNSVDGYISSAFYEFYDSQDNQIGTRTEPIELNFFIRGRVDTSAPETTYILNLGIPISDVTDYLKETGQSGAKAKVFFTIEDAYGHGKEDTISGDFGLYMLKETYVSVSVDPESIPVGGEATITGNLTDLSGYPISGDTIFFNADKDSLTAGYAITDVAGNAKVKLIGKTPGVTNITAFHRYASQPARTTVIVY